jgi:hypothetical protein
MHKDKYFVERVYCRLFRGLTLGDNKFHYALLIVAMIYWKVLKGREANTKVTKTFPAPLYNIS